MGLPLLRAQPRLGKNEVRTVPERYQKELCIDICFVQAFEVKHNRKMMIDAESSVAPVGDRGRTR